MASSPILAGILLIFLIFVMMAAERRSEMGMARAIGVQRRHLVQMFVTEGVVYDLRGRGRGRAAWAARLLCHGRLYRRPLQRCRRPVQRIWRRLPLPLPRRRRRSIVIAYCIGVLFTFVVVTIASWRVSRLNIVAAIRDLPEPESRGGRSSTLSPLRAHRCRSPPADLAAASCYYGCGPWFSLILAGVTLALVGAMAPGLAAGTHLVAPRADSAARLHRHRPGTAAHLGRALGSLLERCWKSKTVADLVQDGPWVLIRFGLTGPMIIWARSW